MLGYGWFCGNSYGDFWASKVSLEVGNCNVLWLITNFLSARRRAVNGTWSISLKRKIGMIQWIELNQTGSIDDRGYEEGNSI